MGRLRELFQKKVTKEEADKKFFTLTPEEEHNKRFLEEYLNKKLLEERLQNKQRQYERSPYYKRSKHETAI